MSTVSIPRIIRKQLRQELWDKADALDWAHLSPTIKARYYRLWSEDECIGGVLSQHIDRGSVRLYIKDTILDDYTARQHCDAVLPRRVLGIVPGSAANRTYTKPHGQWLSDGRIICWGQASAWKLILMAVYERAYDIEGSRPYAAVLHNGVGRYSETGIRSMVELAAGKLGIEVVKWV